VSRGYPKALASSLLFILVCVGCSSMTISPEQAVLDKTAVIITGPIQFEGNSAYLPRTISEGAPSEYGLNFRYTTTETQDRDSWDVLAFFNPLTIVGFPTGKRVSTVIGKLEVLKEIEVVRSYTATCLQEAHRGIYYGASFSELRRRGLAAVRDNIEAQMSRDREFIEKVTSKAFLP
jgi:hypothetical protein